ncbi:MAG: sulfite oxidase [Verrucomicrobia bacterium]|nr:sulfite oxidase [Verrucomicrobiota bacterium]
MHSLSRRSALRGSVAFMAVAFAQNPLGLFGFPEAASDEQLVPFVDPQPMDPNRRMIKWEDLKDWITPTNDLFAVNHYGVVSNADADQWALDISGFVKTPRRLTMKDIRSRSRREVVATLECSGNGAGTGFMGAVGNARWVGTPLGPILKESGMLPQAKEIVFFGADQKTEKIREQDYLQNFARSLSLEEAFRKEVMLCWEMNGKPLTQGHGFPLRVVVPGWYGIAWVKWLQRIEVHDRRYMSKYMARDYVTIRGEEKDGKTVWRETSVSLMNVKSLVGRVTRRSNGALRISGAAWTDGAPLRSVEVQIDQGRWQAAEMDRSNSSRYAWTFWSMEWKNPAPGEHTIVSRATDANGVVQPGPDDPRIRLKKTYWEANQQYPRKIKV